MRLLYISNGDIPSKWAHTFQAVKTAQAPLTWRRRAAEILERFALWMGRVA